MKKPLILLFLSTAIQTLVAASPAEPLPTAVLDFQTSGESIRDKGAEIAVLLTEQLGSSDNVVLVERAELAKILSEQELGLAGNVTPQSAAAVGQLTGAKVLVSGRIFRAGETFMATAKVMSAETGRVYATTTSFQNPTQIAQAATELGTKIREILNTKAGTLTAKPETLEDQIARLQKVVDGKKLPSVSVSVKEQHLSGPVIDPAVDTEMRKLLLALGFDVITASESGRTPDVVISGEAFSETAGRRGGLVSCRARVEIEMKESATGRLLASDRQVSVVVDVSESVAGKRALENASRTLLDRLVPKLAAR